MIVEVVPAALDGERLDRIVALIGDLSRAAAAATIRADGVQVDGAVATTGKVRLSEGQTVAVDPAAVPRTEPPVADDSVQFDVVHEDPAVIVVDKPAGLVVHPGAGNPTGTLVNGLLARYPELADVGDPMRPGIVHRLDAGSSGLLVVARTADAAERLIEQFADHSATRRYEAVVWGVPEAPHGIIDAPIGRSRSDPLRMAVVADGRFARTDYQVLGSYRSPALVSLLECRLETGRTHQIRVHAAANGTPILGDPKYGDDIANRSLREMGLRRLFLHASALRFDWPELRGGFQIEAPLPTELQSVLETLDEHEQKIRADRF